MPEFSKLGQHLYHQGDIPGGQLLLAKIDGEAERNLASTYKIEGFPTIYVQQWINGTAGERIAYNGTMTAHELYKFIREIN